MKSDIRKMAYKTADNAAARKCDTVFPKFRDFDRILRAAVKDADVDKRRDKHDGKDGEEDFIPRLIRIDALPPHKGKIDEKRRYKKCSEAEKTEQKRVDGKADNAHRIGISKCVDEQKAYREKQRRDGKYIRNYLI